MEKSGHQFCSLYFMVSDTANKLAIYLSELVNLNVSADDFSVQRKKNEKNRENLVCRFT